MADLAEVLHTPVTDKTKPEDLEKLRNTLLEQTKYLESKQAEVQTLIDEAKEENAIVTAKLNSKRNLFTETPANKPAGNMKKGREPLPDKHKSPAQKLGFDWETAPHRTDKNGDVVLCTHVLNTTAALDILTNNNYTKDEKVYYASVLAAKALEQQACADSHAEMADARGGRLESKSNVIRAAAGGHPEDPDDSSSHGKGKDKDNGRKSRKSPPPKRHRDEVSRSVNKDDMPPPPPRRDEGGSRGNKQPPRSGGNRDKAPPPRRSRDRTQSPPPVPRHEGGSQGHNDKPRYTRAAQDEPNADRYSKQLAPEDARHYLNDIKAGKDDYLGPVCFGPSIRSVQIPRDMTSVSKTHQRYNGADKPNSWLSDYALAVQIAGGNGLVAARFLPLMLEGTARSWIENLPEKSIHNWQDMEKVFTQHFQGTYKRPNTYIDLGRCVEKPEETATSFLAMWIQTKASCEDVDDN